MTEDAHLTIVRKTGSSKNTKQPASGCQYINTVVNGRQITVYHTAGDSTELRDQFNAAWNGKHPWLTKALFRTVREIEEHDVVNFGTAPGKIRHKRPRDWTKQAVITLGETTEVYMVEVLAKSHCYKQQLISCRFSTCLLL
jgi:hypothetical protein